MIYDDRFKEKYITILVDTDIDLNESVDRKRRKKKTNKTKNNLINVEIISDKEKQMFFLSSKFINRNKTSTTTSMTK
jgi:hypothetical protein